MATHVESCHVFKLFKKHTERVFSIFVKYIFFVLDGKIFNSALLFKASSSLFIVYAFVRGEPGTVINRKNHDSETLCVSKGSLRRLRDHIKPSCPSNRGLPCGMCLIEARRQGFEVAAVHVFTTYSKDRLFLEMALKKNIGNQSNTEKFTG